MPHADKCEQHLSTPKHVDKVGCCGLRVALSVAPDEPRAEAKVDNSISYVGNAGKQSRIDRNARLLDPKRIKALLILRPLNPAGDKSHSVAPLVPRPRRRLSHDSG